MEEENGGRKQQRKGEGEGGRLMCMRKGARMKRKEAGVVSCEWAGKNNREKDGGREDGMKRVGTKQRRGQWTS